MHKFGSRFVLVLLAMISCLLSRSAQSAQIGYGYGCNAQIGPAISEQCSGTNGTSPVAVSFSDSAHVYQSGPSSAIAEAFASATTSADYGHLGVLASAAARAQPGAGSTTSDGHARASFFDMITVQGDFPTGTPVVLEYSVPIEGFVTATINPGGTARYYLLASFNLNGSSTSIARTEANGFGAMDLDTRGVVKTAIGATFIVGMSISVDVIATAGPYSGNDGSSTMLADFSHTMQLFLKPTSTGVTLAAQSSHEYIAPVPEPASYTLFALGLLMLASRGRKPWSYSVVLRRLTIGGFLPKYFAMPDASASTS